VPSDSFSVIQMIRDDIYHFFKIIDMMVCSKRRSERPSGIASRRLYSNILDNPLFHQLPVGNTVECGTTRKAKILRTSHFFRCNGHFKNDLIMQLLYRNTQDYSGVVQYFLQQVWFQTRKVPFISFR
jgi:hypothetical protein